MSLRVKGSYQLTASKKTSPQSYKHKVLDSANNLNVCINIEHPKKNQANWYLGFGLMKPETEKPAQPNWTVDYT